MGKLFKGKKRSALSAALLIILLVASLFGLRFLINTIRQRNLENQKYTAEGKRDIINFVTGYGWSVDEETFKIHEVLIPSLFNEEYEKYNALQRSEGFDLSPFKGRKVQCAELKILNYPKQPDFVYINILISENRIIAGHIYCDKNEGFTDSIMFPE